MNFESQSSQKPKRWLVWSITIIGLVAIVLYAALTGDIGARGASVNSNQNSEKSASP